MGNIEVGNAPCSWGTLEFDDTQAHRVAPDRMLDELVASGYSGSELGDWGFLPTDPDALYQAFHRRQLAITGAFVAIAFADASRHQAGEAEACKIARQLARLADRLDASWQPLIVLSDDNGSDPVRTRNAGRVTDAMRLSLPAAQTFAHGVNRVAAAVHRETGLRCVLHHHCAGYIERPDEIEQMLALTDPQRVGLVFDTGHYAFGAGGCEGVLDALDRFAERIWYVHFKDCQPQVLAQTRAQEWDYFEAVANGIFCELGQGCVDFAGVLTWLKRRNYTGYITVEQDILPGMGAPLESAQRNRQYLRALGI